MSDVHPSEALLARFEHDRMICEVVPSSAYGARPSWSAAAALAAAPLLAMGLAPGLAEEVSRAVATARERDADGPPAALEELLSASTRAARDRALRQQQARRERAN